MAKCLNFSDLIVTGGVVQPIKFYEIQLTIAFYSVLIVVRTESNGHVNSRIAMD